MVDHVHIDQLEIKPIPGQTGSDHKPITVWFDLYIKPISKGSTWILKEELSFESKNVELPDDTEASDSDFDIVVNDEI